MSSEAAPDSEAPDVVSATDVDGDVVMADETRSTEEKLDESSATTTTPAVSAAEEVVDAELDDVVAALVADDDGDHEDDDIPLEDEDLAVEDVAVEDEEVEEEDDEEKSPALGEDIGMSEMVSVESGSEVVADATLGYDIDGKLLPGFQEVVDEMLLFTCDSDFTIYNRYISGDTPLQRLVAVKKLAQMMPLFGCEGAFSLLERVKALATDKELIIRQACAEQLGMYAKFLVESSEEWSEAHRVKVAKARGVPLSEVPLSAHRRGQQVIIEDLLPLIVDMLRDSMEVRQAAGNSLIMMAELLSKAEVHEHVLKIVLHMAHDDTDDQKISSLPLLAELAPIVGRSVCKNYLSSDLNALSQDNSFRVRKATVSYFGALCEQLGPEDSEKTLLPTFKKMTEDTIWSVRKGCVESFVSVTSSVFQETRASLIPVMKSMCKDTSRWVRNAAYEQLGAFIATLTSEQIDSEFLQLYCNIPQLTSADADADCVNHCAFSFPGVALALGRERWPELNDTYHILVRKTFKTRKTIAASLHEICNILGTELTEEFVLPAFDFFLKDIDEIRQGTVRNLWRVLRVLSSAKRKEYLKTVGELAVETDGNWRFRLLLAEQLEELVPLFCVEDVLSEMVDLVFMLCEDRMAVVRYASVDGVRALVDYFNKDGKFEPELDSILRRCHRFQDGPAYVKRLIYIRMCASMFRQVSDELFITRLLPELLKLAVDEVSNIRLALAKWLYANVCSDHKWSQLEVVKEVIQVLRHDEEDVDIMRLFSTEEEVYDFIQRQKERRDAEGDFDGATKPLTTEISDLVQDSDDSSLYSSDDEDPDDVGEVTLYAGAEVTAATVAEHSEAIDDGDFEEEDEEEVVAAVADDSGIRSAVAQMDVDSATDSSEPQTKDMSLDEFSAAQTEASAEDLELAKKNREDFESTKRQGDEYDVGLTHQPTPYRLPGLDSDDDDADADDAEVHTAADASVSDGADASIDEGKDEGKGEDCDEAHATGEVVSEEAVAEDTTDVTEAEDIAEETAEETTEDATVDSTAQSAADEI